MIKRRGIIIIALLLIELIFSLLVVNWFISYDYVSNEEIEKCKEKINLIINGKECDDSKFNIIKINEKEYSIDYKVDKVKFIKFTVCNNTIIKYSIETNKLALAINYMFIFLFIVFVTITIITFVICFSTSNLNKECQEFNY